MWVFNKKTQFYCHQSKLKGALTVLTFNGSYLCHKYQPSAGEIYSTDILFMAFTWTSIEYWFDFIPALKTLFNTSSVFLPRSLPVKWRFFERNRPFEKKRGEKNKTFLFFPPPSNSSWAWDREKEKKKRTEVRNEEGEKKHSPHPRRREEGK